MNFSLKDVPRGGKGNRKVRPHTCVLLHFLPAKLVKLRLMAPLLKLALFCTLLQEGHHRVAAE